MGLIQFFAARSLAHTRNHNHPPPHSLTLTKTGRQDELPRPLEEMCHKRCFHVSQDVSNVGREVYLCESTLGSGAGGRRRLARHRRGDFHEELRELVVVQRVVAGKRGHLAVDAHRVVAPTAEHARDRRVDGLAQWHAPRKPRAHLFFFLCSVCVCMCVCVCVCICECTWPRWKARGSVISWES